VFKIDMRVEVAGCSDPDVARATSASVLVELASVCFFSSFARRSLPKSAYKQITKQERMSAMSAKTHSLTVCRGEEGRTPRPKKSQEHCSLRRSTPRS